MAKETGDRCRFRPPAKGATVVWEVTNYCNLSCTHCLSDSSPQIPRTDDLSTSRFLDTVQEMTSSGVTEFYLTGGEPFARRDLVDIISAIDQKVAEVYVNTNGYFITQEIADALSGTALRRITVSVDGHNRETQKLVRLKPTSFDRAITSVKRLLISGVPVRVSHVAHPGNVDHIAEFCAEMARMGVEALVINSVFPAGRAARHPGLALPAGRKQKLFDELTELQATYQQIGVQIDHSLGRPQPSDVMGCPAGQSVFFVAPNGDLATCSWLYKLDEERFRLGNLKETPFTELRTGVEAMMRPVRKLATACPLPVMTLPVSSS
ncbi:radical SAM protein [Streptomyces sp. B1866]|uniref:radical SAM protein n=1 Tax=Streptomyces sp. B1866 TaxID=3075431 RepID=UPI002890DCCB|nr:radical SAM protein [Streptomyces sp. B1866]MDT3400086.1 radical SAM protein [Streptomyces sp. B1866]